MSDTQVTLGRTLLTSLADLKNSKGDVSLEDVGEMFMRMAMSLSSSQAPADQVMIEEIARLAEFIEDAKKEIFAISTNNQQEPAIIDASAHLDEVIKSTETATNTIMDAADTIQAAAGGIGGEKEQQIMDASTRIYEACNFQDVTGQRITKVIRLLTNIEDRIRKLNDIFGGANSVAKPANTNAKVTGDAALLNGPQLAASASSQDEIDALFASIAKKS